VAHVVIYMDAGTVYSGAGHTVTDPLGLTVGAPMDHDVFPRV
jgi:hypothetical protein